MPAQRRVTEELLGAWSSRTIRRSPACPIQNPVDDWLLLDSYRARMPADRQRVAVWKTGNGTGEDAPGFWGFGYVNGPAREVFADDETGEFFDEDIYAGRIVLRVPLTIPLLPAPLSRSYAKGHPILGGMELFRAPSRATRTT